MADNSTQRWPRLPSIRPHWILTGGLLLATALAWGFTHSSFMLRKRVVNETVRLPLSPPSDTAWSTENAYPNLKFFEPTCIVFAEDGSRRAFVLERRGTVQMFEDDPAADRTAQVIDIAATVWRTPYEDDGAVAIALHPEFGKDGAPHGNSLFMLYTARVEDRRFNRLSCFRLGEGGAAEEKILIDQLNENLWHNGGGLAFGPDGFLYVGVGDEGTNGDGLENGQRIDRDLYCGVLRIDVDRRGGSVSHPPPRQPDTGTTADYYIPSDNPFVGVDNVLEEFWAHGLRNPFRIAFDPVSGDLWSADVGHLRREEINLIIRGGNYGWSFREGSLPFAESYLGGAPPATMHGELKAPLWEYPHLNGDNCIIGGFVYRGEKLPSLVGKYVYADNGSGRVWGLLHDGNESVVNEELLSLPVSSKTGIASLQPDAEGEPLIVILGEADTTSGTIRRIVPAPEGSATALPGQLSETGLFASLAPLTPSPGVYAYTINANQSVGAARVRHWIRLPGSGDDPDPATDRIGYARDKPWDFPTGSVFVQHFDLPVDGSGKWQPVETRVLVRHSQGGVYGMNYRWNEQGTDALLVDRPVPDVAFATATGGHPDSHSTWQVADRHSCLSCHNANAGYVLGVNARQLNRMLPGSLVRGPINQLESFARTGMFREPLASDEIAAAPRLVSPHQQDVAVEMRARSFLDVNCSACHRAGGARANFVAQFTSGETLPSLLNAPKQGDFGIAGAQIVAPGDPFRSILYYRMSKLGQGRMPFVAADRLDSEGLQLLRQWIEQLPGESAPPLPREVAERYAAQDALVARLVSADSAGLDPAEIANLLADTRGAFVLWQAVHDDALSPEIKESVIAAAVDSERQPVRDLFEWFVPPDRRTQRLGETFDLSEVLQVAGDADRGRELFATHQTLNCRTCHDVRPGEVAIGPSLAGVGKKFKRRQLLEQIVDPSAAVEPEFANWMVLTDEGRVLGGLVIQRTDTQLTLKDATGKVHEVPVDSIEEIEQHRESLMPAHLLQSLTPQEAADLLEYLGSLK